MVAWWRWLWAALILVVPGGLVAFAVYLFARAIQAAYAGRVARGQRPTLGQVLSEVRFRDVLREARAAAATPPFASPSLR